MDDLCAYANSNVMRTTIFLLVKESLLYARGRIQKEGWNNLSMLMQRQCTFALENFEGPLDFLLNLIHKEEIDIYEVPIHTIIQQFIVKLQEWKERQIEVGAEFISTVSYLVWLKSKMLLPKQELSLENPIEEPQFEIIHHLLDYCRFKQLSKVLIERQEQQSHHFVRGTSAPEWKKPLGIHHLSLQELADLFKEMLRQASLEKTQIYEDPWRVSDKITFIQNALAAQDSLLICHLFLDSQSRLEWITTFLAILELMKMGAVAVGKEIDTGTLILLKKQMDA